MGIAKKEDKEKKEDQERYIKTKGGGHMLLITKNNRRFFPLFVGLLGIVVLLAACGEGDVNGSPGGNSADAGNGGEDAPASDTDNSAVHADGNDYTIRFGTATETGLYYPIGAILAEKWSAELEGVTASSQATNGSVQNMNLLAQGEIEIALAMGNALLEAFNGEGGFEGNPYEDVRVIGHMYPNYAQVVVRDGSGIESLGDIEGRDIAPGATGSGTDLTTQDILEAYGLSYDDVETHFGGFPEATDMMRNNQVDMAQIVVGIPGAAISEMLSTANGVLTSLDPEALDYMTDKWGYYFESVIPAGTYEGQEEDVTTAAIANALVVDASMPEEVAYEITKYIWENVDELTNAHEIFQQWELEKHKEGIPSEIQFHDGAVRYYKEAGVWEE